MLSSTLTWERRKKQKPERVSNRVGMIMSLFVFLASMFLFVGTIVVWNSFVDKGSLEAIRRYLFCLVFAISLFEVYAYISGSVRSIFLPLVLSANIYGYLDAVIRYPVVPKLESFFCLKLMMCALAKTVAYSVGFMDIHGWVLLFLAALVVNVWLPPILYVLAVPYGDSSPFHRDQDMLLRVFWLIVDRQEREELLAISNIWMTKTWRRFSRPFGGPAPIGVEINEKSYL